MSGRQRHAAEDRAKRRTCRVCSRGNALIRWSDELDYCRWSRDGKCSFTLDAARHKRDDLLERHGHPRRHGTVADADRAGR